MPTRIVVIDASLDVADTIRGAKNPLLIGPTETWWATRTPDGPGTLHLTRLSPTEMQAESWGPGAPWLLEQTPRLLGADDDPTGFAPTGKLGRQWRRKPFRLARTDRPWDAIVGAVLGQKVQSTKARQSRRALARRFGEPAPGPLDGWILPSIDTVASMSYADWHPLGVERKRAEVLIRAARELRRLGEFEGRTVDQVRVRLERIRGIGPWTSNLVVATAYGDPDAVPIGDFHIPDTVAWALAGEPRADDARMLELLEPYAGHRWRVIRLAKSNGPAPRYGPRLSLRGDGLSRGR